VSKPRSYFCLELQLKSSDVEIKPEQPNEAVFQMINDPILDRDTGNRKTVTVNVQTNCGSDGCQSNLTVDGSLPPEVVIGQCIV